MSRNLTDADAEAIAKAICKAMTPHECQFSEDDRHDMRSLLEIYRDTTGAVRKWLIRLAVWGLLLLAGVGIWSKAKGG